MLLSKCNKKFRYISFQQFVVGIKVDKLFSSILLRLRKVINLPFRNSKLR